MGFWPFGRLRREQICISAALKRFPHPSARSLRGSRTIWQTRLAGDLLGVYLHGSLALGRFAEPVSDLDLLIVTGRPYAAQGAAFGCGGCLRSRP